MEELFNLALEHWILSILIVPTTIIPFLIYLFYTVIPGYKVWIKECEIGLIIIFPIWTVLCLVPILSWPATISSIEYTTELLKSETGNYRITHESYANEFYFSENAIDNYKLALLGLPLLTLLIPFFL